MSRRSWLIVDGYNVIRNNPRYSDLGTDYDAGPAWNKARESVINDAALMAQSDYDRCYVVFDGAGNPKSKGKPMRVAGVYVIFSPAGVTADTVIEKLAFEAREKGFEVMVASSDFTIQATVFGGGVTRMSAAGFASAGEEMEEELGQDMRARKQRSTVASRIDPEVAAHLEAYVRGGEL